MAHRALLRHLYLHRDPVRRHARRGRGHGPHPHDPVRRVRPAADLAAGVRRPRPHHPPHHVQLPHDLDGHFLPVHSVLLEGRLDETVPGKADYKAGGVRRKIIISILLKKINEECFQNTLFVALIDGIMIR